MSKRRETVRGELDVKVWDDEQIFCVISAVIAFVGSMSLLKM